MNENCENVQIKNARVWLKSASFSHSLFTDFFRHILKWVSQRFWPKQNAKIENKKQNAENKIKTLPHNDGFWRSPSCSSFVSARRSSAIVNTIKPIWVFIKQSANLSIITDRMCANHSSDLQILRLQLMKRGFWSAANQLEFFRETNLNISNTIPMYFVQFNMYVHVLKYCESIHVLKARCYEIIRVSYFIEKVSGNFLKCGFTFMSLTCKIKFLAISKTQWQKLFKFLISAYSLSNMFC